MSPGLTSAFWPCGRELAEGNAALALEADVHDGDVVIDAETAAGDDGAGEAGVGAERLVEEGGEILAAGMGGRSRVVADAM